MEKTRETDQHTTSNHEMSLAEFPLCMLTKHGYDKKGTYVYEDEIKVDKKPVKRVWKIKPDAELGHATPSTYATLYDLLQIWRDTGFNSQYIHFGSLHELCKRRNVKPGKKFYQQLKDDIRRLVGITYDVENAFWDNTKRMYVSKTFHIFDEATYYGNGGAWGEGYVKVSNTLYNNILSNSLLYLEFDSDFFHKLTPLQQRLAIYLSKIFRFQKERSFRREILTFAKQLPLMTPEKKKIKYNLKKACHGLIEKGFALLERVDFERKSGEDYIVFTRSERKPPAEEHVAWADRPPMAESATQAVPPPEESAEQGSRDEQAEALVGYFHSLFGRSSHTPSQKERTQARSLIAAHGKEAARYIVHYAVREGKKTNFKMRTLGAIFQYKEDALQAYEQEKQQREQYHRQQELFQQIEPTTKAQPQFDGLAEAEKAKWYAMAAAKLVSYKNQMTEAAYNETLEVIARQKFAEHWSAEGRNAF